MAEPTNFDQIDYAYNAPRRIEFALREPDKGEAQVIATIALAEATLALRAEQRTANRIALLATGKGTPPMRERLLAAVAADLDPEGDA